MRAMTAIAAKMTEYQYFTMNLLSAAMLLSESRRRLNVKSGPRGST